MSGTPTSKAQDYVICVEGRLDVGWEAWFDGLTLTLDENGNTLLSGPVADQAALHGLLKRVRDAGMPLLSVHAVAPDTKDVQEP